jgi:hypothetical protein
VLAETAFLREDQPALSVLPASRTRLRTRKTKAQLKGWRIGRRLGSALFEGCPPPDSQPVLSAISVWHKLRHFYPA